MPRSDLSDLSIEELNELRAQEVAQTLSTLDAGSFLRHAPFTWQRPWYESKAPIRVILAGNRTGKTTCMVSEIVSGCVGVKPLALGGKQIRRWPRDICKGQSYLIAGETEEALERDVLKHLRKFVSAEMLAPRTNQHSLKRPWRFVSGAELHFMTYNQALAAVEGSAWHGIGFNEPPPRPFFNAARRGCIDHGGRVIIAATPLEEPWMLDDLLLPAQDQGHPTYGTVDEFHAAMHDNCRDCHPGDAALPHEEIVTFLASLPPAERAAREFGQFSSLIGLEFDYWDENAHVVPDFDVPPRWPLVEVVDPAMKRGLYVMWFACDPENQWYAVRAAHIDNNLGFAGMAAQLDYHRQRLGKKPDFAMMDSRGGMHLANVDTRETWFDMFARQGLRYEKAPTCEDQVQVLHDWLKPKWKPGGNSVPRLRFVKSVTGIDRGPVWGLKRFVWAPMDSKKRRYDQPGKDWVDDMIYLAMAVETKGLTFERYEGSGDDHAKATLATTYASSRRMLSTGQPLRLPWGKRKGLAKTYGHSRDWTNKIQRSYDP